MVFNAKFGIKIGSISVPVLSCGISVSVLSLGISVSVLSLGISVGTSCKSVITITIIFISNYINILHMKHIA